MPVRAGTSKIKAGDDGDPRVGAVFAERYLLTERLGSGRSGVVYRAEHLTLRNNFAVKVLHAHLTQDVEAMARFHELMTCVAKLDSPGIARISDFGRADDEAVFVAQEFLQGETLRQRLERDGVLPESEATQIVVAVADALCDAHEAGVVHGALTPASVWLYQKRGQTRIKLCDFGLSLLLGARTAATERSAEGDGTKSDVHTESESPSQMTAVDPGNLSPEVRGGAVPSTRSDIYGLGLLASAMVGDLRAGDDFNQVRPPDVSLSFREAVRKALVEVPEKRPETAADFVLALTTQLGDQQTAGSAEAATGTDTSPVDDSHMVKAPPADQGESSPPTVAASQLADASDSQSAATEDESELDGQPNTAENKPDRERDGAGGLLSTDSGSWFAEGWAAEEALQKQKQSEPLPSLYEETDVDEPARRGLSPSWIIAGVVAVAAVALGAILFHGQRTEAPAAKRVTVFDDKPSPLTRPQAQNKVAAAAQSPSKTSAAAPLAKQLPAKEVAKREPAQTEPVAARLASASPPVASPAPAQAAAQSAPRAAAEVKPSPSSDKARQGSALVKTSAPASVDADDKSPRARPSPVVKVAAKAAPPRNPTSARDRLRGREALARKYLRRGRRELRRGRYRAAKADFERALASDPRAAEAYGGLGEVSFERGLYREASKHLRVAVRLRPRSSRFRVMLGNAYFKQDRTKDAVAQYRLALRYDPASAEARSGMRAAVRRMADQ